MPKKKLSLIELLHEGLLEMKKLNETPALILMDFKYYTILNNELAPVTRAEVYRFEGIEVKATDTVEGVAILSKKTIELMQAKALHQLSINLQRLGRISD